MSPRRSRPRGHDPEEPRPIRGDVALPAPPGWQVRVITAERAVKEYRCPGCDHEIRRGIAHIVAWREGEEGHRRHWHRGCWERRR